MKTTLNANELRELNTCSRTLDVFLKAHGEKRVVLSEFLESNELYDICWFIDASDDFSNAQTQDIRHFICDCAEDVLSIFEDAYPNDLRPRNAIVVARHFADGDATMEELIAARNDAWDAAKVAAIDKSRAARDAAMAAFRDVVRGAFRDVVMAAFGDDVIAEAMDKSRATAMAMVAARDDVRNAKKEWYGEKLMELFLKWECAVLNDPDCLKFDYLERDTTI